jgi:hypothetical protein
MAGMALVASDTYTRRKTVKKKTKESIPSDHPASEQSKALHVDNPLLKVDVLPTLHYKKEMLNHTAFYHQTVIDELKNCIRSVKKSSSLSRNGRYLDLTQLKNDKNIDVLFRGLYVIRLSGRAVGDSLQKKF